MIFNSQLSTLNSQLTLPLSKSVRARELVLDALAGEAIEIEAENDDLFVLSRALHNAQSLDSLENLELLDNSDNFQFYRQRLKDLRFSTLNSQLSTFNLCASGTALRFLTAYCAVTEGEWVLTGSERLCERPISPLVDALRGMGAQIEYVEKEGFAPLRIRGGVLKGGRVKLDASQSSQFASALMLIADKVEGGIEIEYEGDVASQSYIELTRSVIERYRSGVRRSGERDWSSASVWYAVMAVMRRGRFVFDGLRLDSKQPDRAIVEVFEKLGVKTTETAGGVMIEPSGEVVDRLVVDCKNMPDAVMNIAVAACLMGVEFEISGVETLRVKESDRVEALIAEMRRCGFFIQCIMHNAQCIMHNAQCTMHKAQFDSRVRVKTYNDHRIAMAMAVVGLVMDIEIEEPEVVNKSYPGFWEVYRNL